MTCNHKCYSRSREAKKADAVSLLFSASYRQSTSILGKPYVSDLSGARCNPTEDRRTRDVLLEALGPLTKKIKVGFVFGSMARGSESIGSDVDVLIIGSLSFGAVVDAFFPVQQQLGREINPKVFSVTEWKTKLAKKDACVTQVLTDPKNFLIGDERELAELARRKH